jgi:hypothetical protein
MPCSFLLFLRITDVLSDTRELGRPSVWPRFWWKLKLRGHYGYVETYFPPSGIRYLTPRRLGSRSFRQLHRWKAKDSPPVGKQYADRVSATEFPRRLGKHVYTRTLQRCAVPTPTRFRFLDVLHYSQLFQLGPDWAAGMVKAPMLCRFTV